MGEGYPDDPAPSSRAPLHETTAKLSTGPEADLPPPPSETFAQPSKKKGVFVALGAVAVFGIGAAAFGVAQSRSARAKAETSFGDLSQCLIGEPNAAPAEAVVKFHQHQLALMSRSEKERSEGVGEAWPERCATYALRLHDAADDAGLNEGDGKSLVTRSEEIAKSLKERRALDNDVSKLIENVYQAASDGGVKPKTSGVAGPPEHARALTLDDLPDTAFVVKDYVALKSLVTPVHPGPTPTFLFDQKDGPGPFTCQAQGEKLVCKKLPAPIAKLNVGLSLLGSSDPGAPLLVFAGNRGDAGVYRSDTGALIDKMISYGGHIRADGATALVGYQTDKALLSFQSGDKPAVHVELDEELKKAFDDKPPYRGNAFYNVQLAFGALFLRGTREEEPGIKLWALKLGTKGLERPIEIGVLPEPGEGSSGDDRPHILTCLADKGRMTVRVKGAGHDYLSLLDGGTFGKPIEVPSTLDGAMDCFGARSGFLDGSLVALCKGGTCNKTFARVEALGDLAPRPGTYGRAFVGDEVATVWAAGARGGIRGSKSALEQIGKVGDFVFFDDMIVGGKIVDVPSVTELRLVGAGDHAVLLLQTKKGLAALRISTEGALVPETVVWE